MFFALRFMFSSWLNLHFHDHLMENNQESHTPKIVTLPKILWHTHTHTQTQKPVFGKYSFYHFNVYGVLYIIVFIIVIVLGTRISFSNIVSL